MRGDDQQQSEMFSYVSLEDRVPQDHPLRAIRKSVDEILRAMVQDFEGMYAKTGRPSVPPERLLRSSTVRQLAIFADTIANVARVARAGSSAALYCSRRRSTFPATAL
jgi:hypothetical protein